MSRAGLLCAMCVWTHWYTLRVSAFFCPGIFLSDLTTTLTSPCDASSWFGPGCCASYGPSGNLQGCLSTATSASVLGACAVLGTCAVSSEQAVIMDATAPAIYQSVSGESFCTNVASALGNTGLPPTSACIRSACTALAAFNCDPNPTSTATTGSPTSEYLSGCV